MTARAVDLARYAAAVRVLDRIAGIVAKRPDLAPDLAAADVAAHLEELEANTSPPPRSSRP